MEHIRAVQRQYHQKRYIFQGDRFYSFILFQHQRRFSSLKAVVERPELYKIFLNDQAITPVTGKWWIDKDFKIFDIGKFVKQGKNKLSMIANPISVHAEIEPVYILGNFGLASADKGWDIIKPIPLQFG